MSFRSSSLVVITNFDSSLGMLNSSPSPIASVYRAQDKLRGISSTMVVSSSTKLVTGKLRGHQHTGFKRNFGFKINPEDNTA